MTREAAATLATPFAITMLNAMAGEDFAASVERQRRLGIEVMDLKDGIFGRRLEDLDRSQIREAKIIVEANGMSVQCLSTSLGNCDIEQGAAPWREWNASVLDRILTAADLLDPAWIRILGAFSSSKGPSSAPAYGDHVVRHPWLPAAYSELAERIGSEGFRPVVENEAERCILTNPEDVLQLFGEAGLGAGTGFIWDVQNMWQMGHFPSPDDVDDLSSVIWSIHLKGGIADQGGLLLEASGLRNASWPVVEVIERAIDLGLAQVICLNPSHGRRPAGYDVWQVALDDVLFLKQHFGSRPGTRARPLDERTTP